MTEAKRHCPECGEHHPDEIDDLGGLPPDEDSLAMRDSLRAELAKHYTDRADLNAEHERLEAEYWYQKQLQDERDEAEPVLHTCGYVEDTFACKIRHQYIQHGWAKGDH